MSVRQASLNFIKGLLTPVGALMLSAIYCVAGACGGILFGLAHGFGFASTPVAREENCLSKKVGMSAGVIGIATTLGALVLPTNAVTRNAVDGFNRVVASASDLVSRPFINAPKSPRP